MCGCETASQKSDFRVTGTGWTCATKQAHVDLSHQQLMIFTDAGNAGYRVLASSLFLYTAVTQSPGDHLLCRQSLLRRHEHCMRPELCCRMSQLSSRLTDLKKWRTIQTAGSVEHVLRSREGTSYGQ